MLGTNHHIIVAARRRALWLACANAGLWAFGNGLVGSALVVYLALEYGARGLAVSLILASPRLIGVLRLAAPLLLDRVGNRRIFCTACYTMSTAALAVLPVVSAPGLLARPAWSMAALIAFWTIYHLLEFFGTISLWSWLGDLAPRPIRGRFLGYRERWLTSGRLVGMIAGGALTYHWKQTHPVSETWQGMAICAIAGAAVMLAAVVPLILMPECKNDCGTNPKRHAFRLQTLLHPFRDQPFRRLLIYGSWLAFFNGLTQAAQYVYAGRVLGIAYFQLLALHAGLKGGQSAISPTVGRVIDRHGCRGVFVIAQLLVAVGLLFYVVASPNAKWWIVGAFICWIAYTGLNVGLPKLMLDLSPGDHYAPSVAVYHAVTELCHGVSVVLGGVLLDWLAGRAWLLGNWRFDHFALLFLFGWATRSLGLVWIMRLSERK